MAALSEQVPFYLLPSVGTWLLPRRPGSSATASTCSAQSLKVSSKVSCVEDASGSGLPFTIPLPEKPAKSAAQGGKVKLQHLPSVGTWLLPKPIPLNAPSPTPAPTLKLPPTATLTPAEEAKAAAEAAAETNSPTGVTATASLPVVAIISDSPAPAAERGPDETVILSTPRGGEDNPQTPEKLPNGPSFPSPSQLKEGGPSSLQVPQDTRSPLSSPGYSGLPGRVSSDSPGGSYSNTHFKFGSKDRTISTSSGWESLQLEGSSGRPNAANQEVQEVGHGPHEYRVTVPKPYPGVLYRKSMNLEDKWPRYAVNDLRVHGTVTENGKWLQLEQDIYLPMRVGDIEILKPINPPEEKAPKTASAASAAAESDNKEAAPPTEAPAVDPKETKEPPKAKVPWWSAWCSVCTTSATGDQEVIVTDHSRKEQDPLRAQGGASSHASKEGAPNSGNP